MRIILVFIAAFILSQPAFEQTKKYNIVDFGAKPDGKTLNTSSIQQAIDRANSEGGGIVVIPKGHFLTGSIILKTDVELHLEKNAVLLGTTDPFQYKKLNRLQALILADGEDNLGITGEGTIDGQGRILALKIDSLYYAGAITGQYNVRRKRPNEQMRPQLIDVVKCKNIRVIGIELKNSSSWMQSYDRCENLLFNNIHIENDAYWNSDGFDIVDCKKVRITNCSVNAADDGICLKSEHTGDFNDNIYIANCRVRTSASAVKFGTASVGGFKNVIIKNITVFNTFRSAIAIESVDGGFLENITVDSITATNTGNAIFIRLGHRNKNGKVGTLRNVSIKNVKVQVPFVRPDGNYDLRGPDPDFFHNTFPSSIVGIPGYPVENITLENIEISYPGRGNDGLAILPLYRLKDVPEVEDMYPEFSMFGELPAWGLYVRHVKGLTLKNVSLIAREKDYRPAYVFDDVTGLNLAKCNVKENDRDKQFIMNKVKDASLNIDKNLVRRMDQ